jgi:hypothetical protein
VQAVSPGATSPFEKVKNTGEASPLPHTGSASAFDVGEEGLYGELPDDENDGAPDPPELDPDDPHEDEDAATRAMMAAVPTVPIILDSRICPYWHCIVKPPISCYPYCLSVAQLGNESEENFSFSPGVHQTQLATMYRDLDLVGHLTPGKSSRNGMGHGSPAALAT